MPTYKQRPISKKEAEAHLPLYRPIDHWALRVVENRRKLMPFLILAVAALALFAGFKAYSAYYEDKASQLLDEGQLEGLTHEYGRSKAARIARMKLGKTALENKDYDRALEWFSPVSEDKGAPALLRVSALQNAALIHLKKGETAKALEILNTAAKDPQNSSDDYTQLLLAYVQETSGAKDKALEIYKTLSDGSREPAVREEANARKKWLEPETQPVTLPPSR